MICPHCQNPLRTIEYEGINIETCDACGGEWLDPDELGKVVRAREVKFTPEERRAIAESTTITPVCLEDVDRDLRCPKCGGTTDAVNYGGDTGIVIDRCTKCHGLWLDQAELEKIQQLVEGWDDQLPADLKQYGPMLRKTAERLDREADVRVSRFGFVNALINGILDRIV